jgi:hypothetical protein
MAFPFPDADAREKVHPSMLELMGTSQIMVRMYSGCQAESDRF